MEDEPMRSAVQPALTVSTPGDPSEVEADRAADEVMHMTDSASEPRLSAHHGGSIHRSCTACAAEREDLSAMVARGVSGGGQELGESTRAFMESRFGQDFGHVRVHTGPGAAESARSLDALAYTVGSDIVFGAGRYTPNSYSGRRLLAHELAHTIQQGGGSTSAAVSGSSTPALHRWPLALMMQSSCSGKSKNNCGGSCTHPTSGKPGTCRWSGTITYGCVCYENPTRAVEAIVTALQALLIAAGIVLTAAALAALIACIASGVCEAGAIIAAAGFAAAVLIIGFLRSQGITVNDGGTLASVDTSETSSQEAAA